MGKTIEVTLGFHKEITAEQRRLDQNAYGFIAKQDVLVFWHKMWEEYKRVLKPHEIKSKMRKFK